MAQIASDAFSGTEDTLLGTYNSSWSSQAGSAEIASNRVRASSAVNAHYYHSATPPSPDYSVQADVYVLSTAANGVSVIARNSTSFGNYYQARFLVGTGVSLFKSVASSVTQLGSTVSRSVSAGVSYPLKLVCNGSNISVWWNNEGSALISVTDTSVTAAGKAGIRWSTFGGTPSDTVGLALDNFTVDELGSSLAAQATGGAVASGSAVLDAQVAIAAVGVSVAGGNAVAGVTVPLSATGLSVAGGAAEANATVSISAAAIAQAAGAAGLSADVLLAGAAAAQASGNAELAVALAAMADGAATASGAATLSVSVALQAVGGASAAGSADGSLSSGGAASAQGGANAGGWASWSALVSVTAAGFANAMGAGQLAIEVPLSALGGASASGNAVGTLLGATRNFRLEHAATRLTSLRCTAQASLQAETDVSRLTHLIHGVTHG